MAGGCFGFVGRLSYWGQGVEQKREGGLLLKWMISKSKAGIRLLKANSSGNQQKKPVCSHGFDELVFFLFYFSLSDFVSTTRVTVRAIHSPN